MYWRVFDPSSKKGALAYINWAGLLWARSLWWHAALLYKLFAMVQAFVVVEKVVTELGHSQEADGPLQMRHQAGSGYSLNCSFGVNDLISLLSEQLFKFAAKLRSVIYVSIGSPKKPSNASDLVSFGTALDPT